MSDQSEQFSSGVSAELISGLSVVESQPLDQRADGYTRLYDELKARLESDDIAR